jgi:N-acetylmuramoyl-L-alanine amidase
VQKIHISAKSLFLLMFGLMWAGAMNISASAASPTRKGETENYSLKSKYAHKKLSVKIGKRLLKKEKEYIASPKLIEPKVFIRDPLSSQANALLLSEHRDKEVFGPLKLPELKPTEHKRVAMPALPSPNGKRIIIIDPGHGGNDPGTISPRGYPEKNVTLAFAKEIHKMLNQTSRYQAVLTRSEDTGVALRDRYGIARELGANLFISLHADSNPHKDLKGFSVYTLSAIASDEESQKLATTENKADVLLGLDLTENCPEISNILIDLAQRDTLNKSIYFAGCFLESALKGYKLPVSSPRHADFAVLKAPDIPSVLIELGYLSNSEDEARLIDKNYQKKIAQVLIKAIDNFFENVH